MFRQQNSMLCFAMLDWKNCDQKTYNHQMDASQPLAKSCIFRRAEK